MSLTETEELRLILGSEPYVFSRLPADEEDKLSLQLARGYDAEHGEMLKGVKGYPAILAHIIYTTSMRRTLARTPSKHRSPTSQRMRPSPRRCSQSWPRSTLRPWR